MARCSRKPGSRYAITANPKPEIGVRNSNQPRPKPAMMPQMRIRMNSVSEIGQLALLSCRASFSEVNIDSMLFNRSR